MDGQNFQNEQNNTSSSTNNYYQDNTQQNNTQYSQPAYSQTYTPEPSKPQTPALAIVSLVMGILSIVLGCCYGIGIIFAIAGIIMAVIANKQTKTGVGIAGLVCSIIGAVFSVIMLIYYVVVIAAVINDPSIMDMYY